MQRLSGKVALITGAGRGIGAAIAWKLASEGAKVVINDRDGGPASQVAKAIRDAGGEAMPYAGDVVSPEVCECLVASAIDGFGGLDIIVNNAGYTWDNVIQKMADAQWRAMLDVHLTAPFQILRAASHFIRTVAKRESAEGREVFRKVVNISSIAGLYGIAGQVNYSAAKAGIVGLTHALCQEWGRYKVNVNCVAFGLIKTRLVQPLDAETASIDIGAATIKVGIHPAKLESMSAAIPLGRHGTPEEAAGCVFLLCIPESDYISGQVIVCGGGL